MKKLLVIIGILCCLFFAFSACGVDTATERKTDEAADKAQESVDAADEAAGSAKESADEAKEAADDAADQTRGEN